MSTRKITKSELKVLDRDFIMEHIFIGLQRSGEENIIKKDSGFEGIESYLMLRWEENDQYCCLKITVEFLSRLNIYINEAWEQAEKNTNEETVITPLDQMLNAATGIESTENIPLFVISNKDNNRGASAILNKSALADFGRKYNIKKAVVMPSSIHEMLLCPYDDDDDIETYTNIVREVNKNEVLPEEWLANRAYVITL